MPYSSEFDLQFEAGPGNRLCEEEGGDCPRVSGSTQYHGGWSRYHGRGSCPGGLHHVEQREEVGRDHTSE